MTPDGKVPVIYQGRSQRSGIAVHLAVLSDRNKDVLTYQRCLTDIEVHHRALSAVLPVTSVAAVAP